MLESAKTDLTLLGMHLPGPSVFWRGTRLLHVVRVRAHADQDDGDVTIKVQDPAGEQEALYAEMAAAGIIIRRGST